MKKALLALGLVAASGCSILNSFDDVDQGGAGANGGGDSGGQGGDGGATGGGGAGAQAGDGGMGAIGGMGGMGGVPPIELNCAFELQDNAVIEDLSGAQDPFLSRFVFAAREGTNLRAFVMRENALGLHVYSINDDGSSPAQGIVPEARMVLDVQRLDLTRIGVLVLERNNQDVPVLFLYVFEDSDFSFTPNKIPISTMTDFADAPPFSEEEFRGRFVKVGTQPDDIAVLVQYQTDAVAKIKFGRHPPGPPVQLKQILPDAGSPDDVEIRAFGRANDMNIAYIGQPFSQTRTPTQRFVFGDGINGNATPQSLGEGQIYLLGAATKGNGTTNVAMANLSDLGLFAGNVPSEAVSSFTIDDLNGPQMINGEELPDGGPNDSFLGDFFPFIGELDNGDLGIVAFDLGANESINDVLSSPSPNGEIQGVAIQPRDGTAQFGSFGGRVHTVWVEDIDKGNPGGHSKLFYNIMECILVQ